MAGAGSGRRGRGARGGGQVGVVSRWGGGVAEEGSEGLDGRKRSGRPGVFAATVVAQVKAMACEPPEDRDVPQSRWSAADLAARAVQEGLAESVSRSTVRRWLEKDAIRPWRYRSWIFPRDPDFAVKAGRVLDLYQRVREGRELGDDEYVLSTDEKSQLQILSRCHPRLPPGPRPPGRHEFQYARPGTVAYLAAYDVHRAHLMGRVVPTT